MELRKRLIPQVLLCWFLLTQGNSLASASETQGGMIVEEVYAASVLKKIGLQPGDALLGWERVPKTPARVGSQGSLDSLFDWFWLNIEQVPRTGIRLTVRQHGLVQVLEVPEGHWGIKVRPAIADNLQSFITTRDLLEQGLSQQAASTIAALVHNNKTTPPAYWASIFRLSRGDWATAQVLQAISLEEIDNIRDQALGWLSVADLQRSQENFQQAISAYQEAIKLAESFEKDSLLVARVHYELANTLRLKGDIRLAEEYSVKALRIQEDVAPNSMPVAISLDILAILNRNKGDLNTAKRYGIRALEILERLAPSSFELARSLSTVGTISIFAGDLEVAERQLNRALAIRRSYAPRSDDVAANLQQLALIADRRGDRQLSERLHQEVLDLLKEIKPESSLVATVLRNLGVLAWRLGKLDLALRRYQEALSIQDRLSPEGIEAASILSGLSAVLQDRGNFEEAEACLNRALKIISKVAPNSATQARILHNLGTLAYSRADFDLARDYYQKALLYFQDLEPTSRELPTILTNIGALAAASLDLDLAEENYRRALKLAQAAQPEGGEVAGLLLNMGVIAYDRGHLQEAEDYQRRALKIFRTLAPSTLHVADCLHNLGNIAAARGDRERAEDYHRQSLAIVESLVPDSIDMASGLHSLGISARQRGNLAQALIYHKRALGIVEKLAPGSWKETSSQTAIAYLLYLQGETQAAVEYLQRAIESLDHQIIKFGEQRNAKLAYRTQYKYVYSALIELLIQENRPEDAFVVLERSRARDLLEMLAYRDLTIKEIPPELAAKKRQVEIAYDQVQQKIFSSNHSERASTHLESLSQESRKLMREYEELVAQIRLSSARFAALRYPQPIGFEVAQQALDSGTVLLAYDVSDRQTSLFIVRPKEPIKALLLELKRDELDRDITLLRSLIEGSLGSAKLDATRLQALQVVSRRLYRQLVEPAATEIESSTRILIIPDGPLHLLPFGVLMMNHSDRDYRARSRPTYLTEWRPVHTVISSTLYSELKETRSMQERNLDRPAPIIAAFGSPYLPSLFGSATNLTLDSRIRSAVDRGFNLAPLPYARDEVERIKSLFPEHTLAYLDSDASEARAKSLPQNVRYVHFATHAILDGLFPLNSAVVLTIPEHFEKASENGLLQTWEILEQLRLDADLIVLSACESGLGKEMGGEGLIGLTRAFQYAGARSVMASLWKISDRTTAEFMVRFYSHLKAGLTKDEALRATQMEFIRGPIQVTNDKGERVEFDASAPYYWAAFQIYGDWQ